MQARRIDPVPGAGRVRPQTTRRIGYPRSGMRIGLRRKKQPMMQPRRFDARQSQLGHGAISDMPMDKRPLSSIERRAACGRKSDARQIGLPGVGVGATCDREAMRIYGRWFIANRSSANRAPSASRSAAGCCLCCETMWSNCASIARLR
ncbi:hypothetical protein [Burkholderia multivorans]|uniref:hypothetical protein n=1 Tax=Burkholderia multivorans TaxID=87883 RepID=UPI0020188CF9|nr:hypothetical protein [Burkholderia multivorans]MCL4651543.1 hypothetical protein [Burkholderia multivorans]MCL4655234.1 hypothetical protein [Burkholderia multivorans]MCO1426048.1 hypothetical protein [Burkholderia multivorans]UQN54075.1 hypothetical protein L0Y88_09515 [Burkholderia multivorans]UQN84750.1 hypothetical protein L0Z18_19090 [Burkholderia multivorans]